MEAWAITTLLHNLTQQPLGLPVGGRGQRNTLVTTESTQKRFSLSNVKEVFRWFSDSLRDVKRDPSSCPLCLNNKAHFPNAPCSFTKSVKVERWDLLNVLWAASQCAGPVQHASTVWNKTGTTVNTRHFCVLHTYLHACTQTWWVRLSKEKIYKQFYVKDNFNSFDTNCSSGFLLCKQLI